MPDIGNFLLHEKACEVELEKLFLPSSFDDRNRVCVVALGVEEIKFREGAAFDALCALQTAVKTITALRGRKVKNDRGQAANTRSSRCLSDCEARRDLHMASYTAHRQALIKLGFIDKLDPHSIFPELTLPDTFMKSTEGSRCLGDSRRTDGLLWASGAVGAGNTVRQVASMDESRDYNVEVDEVGTGTQMMKRKAGKCIQTCILPKAC